MLLIGVMFFLVLFFFFKQKTAYEMRISDWSSDVCSSDLSRIRRGGAVIKSIGIGIIASLLLAYVVHDSQGILRDSLNPIEMKISYFRLFWSWPAFILCTGFRSEEHTSELQSLMRISYAVFCLKKKKHNTDNEYNNEQNKK